MAKKETLSTIKLVKNAAEIFHNARWANGIVVCPYCGAAIDEADLIDYPELYEDGEHKISCIECDKKFKVETMVSYDWETHKMEEE